MSLLLYLLLPKQWKSVVSASMLAYFSTSEISYINKQLLPSLAFLSFSLSQSVAVAVPEKVNRRVNKQQTSTHVVNEQARMASSSC